MPRLTKEEAQFLDSLLSRELQKVLEQPASSPSLDLAYSKMCEDLRKKIKKNFPTLNPKRLNENCVTCEKKKDFDPRKKIVVSPVVPTWIA